MSLNSIGFLTECYHRELMNKEEQSNFYIAEKGATAETELKKVMRDYIPKDWLMKGNLWLRHYHTNEVDILLVTDKFLWAVECKNYSGLFEYIEGSCYMNQTPMHDEVAKVKNRESTLKNILKDHGLGNVPVFSSMIFMNNECDVFMDSDPGFKAVMRYRLNRHMDEMINKHKTLSKSFDVQQIISALDQYTIEYPYPPKSLEISDLARMKPGIHCANCYSYSLENSLKLLKCHHCGHIEFKKEAKLRTVAEIGMLFYNEEKILTPANLKQVGGDLLPRNSLHRALYGVWPSHGFGKGIHYHNYGLPYSEVKAKLFNK